MYGVHLSGCTLGVTMFLCGGWNRHLATLLLVLIVSCRQIRICAAGIGLSTGLLSDPEEIGDEDKATGMSQDRSGLEIVQRKTLRDGVYFELPRHTIRNWHVKGSFRHHPETACKRIGKFYVFGDIHHATLLLTVPKSDLIRKFYVSCRGLLQVPIPRRENYPLSYLLPVDVLKDDIYAQTIPLSCLQDAGIMPHFEVVLASEDCSTEFLNRLHTWILLSGPVKS